jgi:hypothetical protein
MAAEAEGQLAVVIDGEQDHLVGTGEVRGKKRGQANYPSLLTD